MSIKLTKNEQKKQKDALKQYQRYLPTLQLKKKQLQSVIRDVERKEEEVRLLKEKAEHALESWVALFAENIRFKEKGLESLVVLKAVHCKKENIAGVEVPIFESIEFENIHYHLEDYPLWVDRGVETLKNLVRLKAMSAVLKKELEALSRELKSTSQRVNLFEKVKIPETKENIKKIAVALGDASTAAVVRGKIAKKKLVKQGENA